MRKFLIALFCLFSLTVTASAAGVVSQLESNTRIDTDGTCEVSLTMQLRIDSGESIPSFPVPEEAKDVSVNGRSVRAKSQGGYRQVELSEAISGAGIHTVTIRYSLPDSITLDKKGIPFLNLELLCGFAYPIEHMIFVINLPGEPENNPEFFSTYYQETADSLFAITIQGNEIRGVSNQQLKDRESLSMTMEVTEALFPQSVAKRWKMGTDDMIMIGLAVLAVGYWLLTMRSLPPKHSRRTTAPEGLTAGELGCCITAQGVDFTMTVVSWAQMGYLRIQVEENGRVLLIKRMDMGNERSDFEVRYFKTLFGKKEVVDATGMHYARLCRKASKVSPGIRDYYQRRSGNPYIFRGICAIMGLMGGVSLGISFANDTVWQVLLAILLGGLCLVFSWVIQSGAGQIHLRRKWNLWMGLGASVVWILLGIWSREWNVALFSVLGQWITGLAAAYGGRRSEPGRQYLAQIMGLRRFLSKVSTAELQRILQVNPEYFYTMAPYAMALGVDRNFVRQFGKLQLPECTYLTTEAEEVLTPKEWNQLLRDAVEAMEERQKPAILEKIFGKK